MIKLSDLILIDKKFSSFKKLEVKTSENDFLIENNKKIHIRGKKFDGTNLAKFISNQASDNKFEKVNSNIEIDFKNIKIPMSEKLENFKLLGEIML